MRAAVTLLAAALLAAPAFAEKPKPEAPGPKAKGKLCEWKSKDGLAYVFFVPKTYDAEQGANLVFILHGSNLARGWGFANHKIGEWRKDKKLKLPKEAVKDYDELVPEYQKAIQEGFRAFEAADRKAKM